MRIGRCCCTISIGCERWPPATGWTAALHPHVGTAIESRPPVLRLIERSDVPLCLDTGHLLIGGMQPAELLELAADRIAPRPPQGRPGRRWRPTSPASGCSYLDAVRAGLYVPLGEGDVDIAGIVNTLETCGYQGWYVLEQDCALDAAPAAGVRTGRGCASAASSGLHSRRPGRELGRAASEWRSSGTAGWAGRTASPTCACRITTRSCRAPAADRSRPTRRPDRLRRRRAHRYGFDRRPQPIGGHLLDRSRASRRSASPRPNFLHRELGTAFARAGKHIWIEKPVGLTAGRRARGRRRGRARPACAGGRLQLPQRAGGRARPPADRRRCDRRR